MEGILVVVSPCRKRAASWPERAMRRRVVRSVWPVRGGGGGEGGECNEALLRRRPGVEGVEVGGEAVEVVRGRRRERKQ